VFAVESARSLDAGAGGQTLQDGNQEMVYTKNVMLQAFFSSDSAGSSGGLLPHMQAMPQSKKGSETNSTEAAPGQSQEAKEEQHLQQLLAEQMQPDAREEQLPAEQPESPRQAVQPTALEESQQQRDYLNNLLFKQMEQDEGSAEPENASQGDQIKCEAVEASHDDEKDKVYELEVAQDTDIPSSEVGTQTAVSATAADAAGAAAGTDDHGAAGAATSASADGEEAAALQ